MAEASEFNIELLDFRLGGRFTSVADSFATGGYELDQGEYVSFDDWYSPKFREISVRFLSIQSPNLGLTLGVGTGERGEKYRIHPSIELGLIYQKELFPNGWLTFLADVVIGGSFLERTCMAEYDLSNIPQTVNCRYAAAPIPPKETLEFLEKRRGYKNSRAALIFEYRF